MNENTEAVFEKFYDIITKDLVKLAIEKDKGEDVKLLSFHVEPLSNKGNNHLSDIASIQVNYHKKGSDYQEFYVAKINPCQPDHPFKEATDILLPHETNIYHTIIGGMNEQLSILHLPPIKTPKIYARSLEKGREAFIMDNLMTQGFKLHNISITLDLDHALLALKELGRFHASSLLYEDTLYPKTIMELFDFKNPLFEYDNESFKNLDTIVRSNVKTITDILKKEGPKYEKYVAWLHDHRDQIAKYFCEGYFPEKPFDFEVFIHGDCWTNNFLFRYDGKGKPIDVKFVDLQLSRKASPATDINFFLHLSLSRDLSMEKNDYLMLVYYSSFTDTLTRAGKCPLFTYQDLVLEVKSRKIFGLSAALVCLPGVTGENIASAVNMKSEENVQNLCFNMESQSLMMTMDGKSVLKERLLPIFDEFINIQAFN